MRIKGSKRLTHKATFIKSKVTARCRPVQYSYKRIFHNETTIALRASHGCRLRTTRATATHKIFHRSGIYEIRI